MLKVGAGQPAALRPARGQPGPGARRPTTPSTGSGRRMPSRPTPPSRKPAETASAIGTQYGIYTSTTMSNLFGLNQLFGQGRTGVGQTIAVVEFEQYLSSDVSAFRVATA